MRYEERIYWNNNAYELNYWKRLDKRIIMAGLIFIIALPIGTAWMGIPAIFKGILKGLEAIAYTMGWKLI